MSGPKEAKVEYCFVPLGRERGGYLDFLKLSADADQHAVAEAEEKYRRGLKKKLREQRGPLVEQKKAKQITEEEYKAKDEELQAQNAAELADFQELKQKFELLQAERRKMANEGRKDTSSAWADAYGSFGKDCAGFWQFLLAPPAAPAGAGSAGSLGGPVAHTGRPGRRSRHGRAGRRSAGRVGGPTAADGRGPQAAGEVAARPAAAGRGTPAATAAGRGESRGQDQAEAKAVWARWREEDERVKRAFAELARPAAEGASAGSPHPVGRSAWTRLSQFRLFSADAVDVATVWSLVCDRELVRLLWADGLWHELRVPTASFGRGRSRPGPRKWRELGPRLQLDRTGPRAAADGGDYPALCQLADRSIDRLETKELGDLAGACAAGTVPDLSDPLMAAFLRPDGGRAAAERGKPGGIRRGSCRGGPRGGRPRPAGGTAGTG